MTNGNRSSWAQYTVRSPKRTLLTRTSSNGAYLRRSTTRCPCTSRRSIPGLGLRDEDFPMSVKASQEVFSLPMHPFLTHEEVRQVGAAVREALR